MYDFRKSFEFRKGMFGLGFGYKVTKMYQDSLVRKMIKLHTFELLLGPFVLYILWETGKRIKLNDN